MKDPTTTQVIEPFQDGYNCAQAVLYAYCDEVGLDPQLALKLSCGFGAGMGRSEEVCGAVTGGIMVLGARFGRGRTEEKAAMEKTYARTRELMSLFKERHGSYICRELLQGCDLMSEQGQKQFHENDLLNQTCKPCVQSVVEIVKELIK